MMQRIVVAIDGPAGAGKSTVARLLADKLGFVYVDSGAMYRSIALWAKRANVNAGDMHRLEQLAQAADIQFEAGSRRILLNGSDVSSDIRTPEISLSASRVAAVPAVRRALVQKQRRISEANSVVMEGRDIGSVVFPDAQIKIFLDATPDIRAARRCEEFRQRGQEVDDARTAEEMVERDHRDRTRAEAPLMQAPDAVYIDSGNMAPAEIVEMVLKIVRDRTSNGKEYSR